VACNFVIYQHLTRYLDLIMNEFRRPSAMPPSDSLDTDGLNGSMDIDDGRQIHLSPYYRNDDLNLGSMGIPGSFAHPGMSMNPISAPNWAMADFVHRNEDPWVPKGSIPQGQLAHSQQGNPGYNTGLLTGPQFNGYRSALPSEAGTVPPGGGLASDSGYDTKHSIHAPSVFGDPDRGQETNSVTGGMLSLDFGGSLDGNLDWISSMDPSPPLISQNESERRLTCPTCNASVKTNSELTYVAP
jgi:hypothetical protein